MPRANFVAYEDIFPPEEETLLFFFKLFSLYYRIRLLASDSHTIPHSYLQYLIIIILMLQRFELVLRIVIILFLKYQELK